MTVDRIEQDPPRTASGDGARAESARRARGGSRRVAVTIIALVLAVAAGIWAYRANKSAPSMDMKMRVASGDTPFPVTLAQAERRAVAGNVTYTGSVAPFNEEDVYPRVTGRLVEVPVYPGDAVRPGQLVAKLDDVELGSRVREAQAGVATSQANRAQMDADLAAAQQEVIHMEKELAQMHAEATYWRGVIGRSERLFQAGAVSRQDYENDRSMAASAEAKEAAAQAKLVQSRAMEVAARKKIEAGDFMVAQSRAQLRTAQIVQGYVNISSPTGGYVVKRLVAPGVLVQPGMAILKIAQIDRVRLQANVGEKDIAAIRVGSPVRVTMIGGTAPILTARVTAVAPFVDPGSRTAMVEAIVDNRDRRFLPGQYVMLQFVTGDRPDALAVPRGAVVRLGSKATVWVVRDGVAQAREVTTGLEGAEWVEITGGVQPGERVIARGHEGLYNGARVADASAPAPPAAGHTGHGGPNVPGMEAPAAPAAPGHDGHGGTTMPGMDMPASPPPAPPASGGGHSGHGATDVSTKGAPAHDGHDAHGGMDMPGMDMSDSGKETGHGSHSGH